MLFFPDLVHFLDRLVRAFLAGRLTQQLGILRTAKHFLDSFEPEAIQPLLVRDIPGFGELFRYYSLKEIGTSTIQSRAFAGVANATLIFGLPGSTGACRTAWDRILKDQLDARTGPCNFVSLIPRLNE